MGWCIKNTNGSYVSGFEDGEAKWTTDFDCSWWWDTEDDAQWYIDENGIEDADPEDSNGSSPPGNGQPGKP
jgi:hypothetical protein